MKDRWRRLRSELLRPIRFEQPLEQEFLADFEAQGRDARSELWIVLLVAAVFVLAFHHLFLQLPSAVLPLGRLVLIGLAIPATLRALSSRWSPLRGWSAELYIGAAFIDIAGLLLLRVACLRSGYDVVPLIMPVAVLTSLIVVQIRFLLLVPTVLLGLGLIVGVELWAFDLDSNRLFQVTAALALVLVALSPAYEIERWVRIGWRRERHLNALAYADELTGLATRRSFDAGLRQAIRAAARERKSVALMILDIDHFKAYNDHYGHPAGDDCLRAVSAYLGGAMRRPLDLAARLGGEEFAAVWFDAAPGDAARLAEALRGGISGLAIRPAPGHGAAVTASAGLVQVFAPPSKTAAGDIAVEMLRWADEALYAAKRAGRNRLVVSETPIAHDATGPDRADGGAVDALSDPDPRQRRHERTPRRPTPLLFDEPLETEFRAEFERQGRGSRRLILGGLLLVIAILLMFQRPLLKIPEAADFIGRLTLVGGLVPATLLGLLGSSWPRCHRWSAGLYILAVGGILSAQMLERVIQLPKGYDVVPLIMPVSVLLSLSVVQLRFPLLAPAILLGLAGVAGTELWAFALTSNRLLEVVTTSLMVAVTLRFSYKLERSTRLGWLYKRDLDDLAHSDALTGLANRRHFDRALRQLIRVAARDGRNLALMLMDVDHFKSYNDFHGHLAGDDCLRAIGRQLAVAMRRPQDFAARLGGEEFAAVWFDAHPEDAARLGEALRQGVAGLGLASAPGRGAVVTMSAGLVQIAAPPPDESAEQIAVDLMREADAALYAAKREGRDRLVVRPLPARRAG